MMLKTVVHALKATIQILNIILSKDKLITFVYIRKFILCQLLFALAELNMYAAFRAPESDIFY